MACSSECAAALARGEKAVELVLRRSTASTQATSLGCYLIGSLFLACGILSIQMMPSLFLLIYMTVSGVGMLVSGVFGLGELQSR